MPCERSARARGSVDATAQLIADAFVEAGQTPGGPGRARFVGRIKRIPGARVRCLRLPERAPIEPGGIVAERAEVVFVDGVRTPFGRAGEKGSTGTPGPTISIVKAMIGLLERNPQPPEGPRRRRRHRRHDPEGDQGLTLGRTAAILAGLPLSGARLRDRPHVRRRDDERHDDRRRDRASAPTTSASPAASSTWAATRWASAPTRTRASSPRSSSSADALNMGNTAERIHDRFPQLTKERADRFGMRSQQKVAAAYEAGKIQPDLDPRRHPERGRLGTRHPATRACAPRRRWRASPASRRRSARTAASRPATPPPSPTARPCRSSRARDAAKEFGLTRQDAHGELRASPASSPRSWASARCPSTEKALRKAGLTIDDIGLFELNEAFAVQVLSLLDHFGIDDDDPRVNQWGGAIAIGHPLASSGVRLMIQLAAPVRGAPRGALRPHRHVRRPRPGRHRSSGRTRTTRERK